MKFLYIQSKARPNDILRFHDNMTAALAKNSDQTLHVVHSVFGIANLTMLDGGFPGSQPITTHEDEPADTEDVDDLSSEPEDDSSWSGGKTQNKKNKRAAGAAASKKVKAKKKKGNN